MLALKHARLPAPTPFFFLLLHLCKPQAYTLSWCRISKPMRPPKRSLEDMDPEKPAAKKRRRPSLCTWPVHLTSDLLHKAPCPSFCLSGSGLVQKSLNSPAVPVPVLASDCTPSNKYLTLPSPTLFYDSSVQDWLSNLPHPRSFSGRRPDSAPPRLGAGEGLQGLEAGTVQPPSTAIIKRMAPPRLQGSVEGSVTSTPTSRPGTSSRIYRSVIHTNGIQLDDTGDEMPEEIREFVKTTVLKERTSSRLGQESIRKVKTIVKMLADNAEASILDLIHTDIFPEMGLGIGRGGNTPWSPEPLPRNDIYPYRLSIPKPDFHYGYPIGRHSDWTAQETAVLDHVMARPYTQPARGNCFPFLIIEAKSEAAGGTLWLAENQAAGSGSHAVNGMRWLLAQAQLSAATPTDKPRSETNSHLDSLAFTIAMTNRHAFFYAHYYLEAEKKFYMSYIADFSFIKPSEIQACRDTIQNILDHGLEGRRTTIRWALGKLFPFPDSWKVSRSANSEDSASVNAPPTETTALIRNPERGRYVI